jgi:hypothetical protein
MVAAAAGFGAVTGEAGLWALTIGAVAAASAHSDNPSRTRNNNRWKLQVIPSTS